MSDKPKKEISVRPLFSIMPNGDVKLVNVTLDELTAPITAIGDADQPLMMRTGPARTQVSHRTLTRNYKLELFLYGLTVEVAAPHGHVTVCRTATPGTPVAFKDIAREALAAIMDFAAAPHLFHVVPNEYPDDTVFLCQACNRRYAYGAAKTGFGTSLRASPNDPLCFCSVACKDRYLADKGRYPAVAAEIPLGPMEPCNVHPAGGDTGDADTPVEVDG